MSWFLAIVIIAMLFIGGCALWVQAASDSAQEFMEYAERSFCYDGGYQDGRTNSARHPDPAGSEACDGLYNDGYNDGKDGNYEPPTEQG